MCTGRSLTVCWGGSLLLGDTPSTRRPYQKAIPEGHNRRPLSTNQKARTEDHFQPEDCLQSEGHQTRRPPNQKATFNQKAPNQKAITEGHIPRPGTPPGADTHPLGADTHTLGADTPWSRHPPTADPPRSRHPQSKPPRSRHPPETCCKACWDTTCNACWDSTPPCEQNHRHE